ncbi:MAG: 16S rRNA methyltransferase [Thermoprotei archaeon]|nr:MAG: 16S rRNA methyltransferase [Thermoprotei archaeon]
MEDDQILILNIILIESALELIPKELWDHPAVLKNARRRGKKPGEVLLDTSLHYHAMKKLKDREKRGRPDIIHISLLNALSSPLNIEGKLRIYVHTINDYIIFIRPDTRIPRNYQRFVGLIEQLFKEGKVPPNSQQPLLYIKDMSLPEFLDTMGKKLLLLSETGTLVSPDRVIDEALSKDYIIGIGGFPHGDFSKYIYELADKVYSIYPKPLDTWIVVSRIIEACERKIGLYKSL